MVRDEHMLERNGIQAEPDDLTYAYPDAVHHPDADTDSRSKTHSSK